jgi:long-chain acyl-CoA synthetase
MGVNRIFDLLDRYDHVLKTKVAFAAKEDGEWKKYSYEDYIRLSNWVSCSLLAMGIETGDKVATIFSNSRPEWNFIDMGIAQIGAIHVPIYPTISHDEFTHVFNHSEAKLAFVSDKLLYRKLKPVLESCASIQHTLSINEVEGLKSWSDFIRLGEKSAAYYQEVVEKIKQKIQPKDLATIIYTSGTTGLAKGVMLSHQNLVSNAIGVSKRQHLPTGSRILSFLPLCHVYERTMLYKYQYLGMEIYYAENVGTIGDNLKEIRPHGFDTVPRLLESVFDKIIAKGNQLSGFKKKLFFWAVELSFEYKQRGNSWFYKQQHKIAERLVYSKWREALGGEVDFIACGSAALQPKLERVFGAAGIPIFQGYGLTESSPIITTNYKIDGTNLFGTVGPVLDNVEVRIADDGEILAKGPNIMMGYYKDPERTAEVIDNDGWLHTGDVGEFIDGRFLKITDRKKEMFKTTAGKYIAPQPIENRFKESYFIQQAMVIGENEKFASALILPDFDFLQKWARENGILFQNKKELITHDKVLVRLQQEINTVNKQLGLAEQIKRFRLIDDEWTPISGELSPTLKLKRKYIADKYKAMVEEIYLK